MRCATLVQHCNCVYTITKTKDDISVSELWTACVTYLVIMCYKGTKIRISSLEELKFPTTTSRLFSVAGTFCHISYTTALDTVYYSTRVQLDATNVYHILLVKLSSLDRTVKAREIIRQICGSALAYEDDLLDVTLPRYRARTTAPRQLFLSSL